jgi:hypothetical protein
MKMKIVIILAMLFNLLNCGKDRDDKLNLIQQDFNGNQLRLDGFYYKEFENTNGGISFDRFTLYQNGIIRYLGSVDSLNHNQFFSNNFKGDWGLFEIENDNIKFERWASGGGPFNAYMSEGKILNDSTFHITKRYRLKNEVKTEIRTRNDIYHFKQFSPKPDSTNNFIR